MNDKQFAELMKAVNEISSTIVVGVLGLGIIIAVIGLVIADLLR